MIDTFYSFYARITSYPLIIQICIVFILACIILFSFFIGLVSYIRLKHTRKSLIENKHIPIIDELILKYVFEQDQIFEPAIILNDFETKLGKLDKNNLALITQRLITCKYNFDLRVNEQFQSLIRALGIEAYVGKKLDYASAFDKMKGIQELSSLAITASESRIFPFTYSGNKNLRKEARSSYMRLSRNDPFKFFDESKEPLNEWDKINLMKHLMSIENNVIPNFSKWIAYSENESIVQFSIQMVSFFQQREAIPVLINFLQTTHHELRAEAIKALGDLKAVDAEDILKDMYINQPAICQQEIIRAVGKFKSGNSLYFLQSAFEQATSVDTQKVTAEAIYNYNEDGRQLFARLQQDTTDFSRVVLSHIANPLIKFK